jgi:hypothetical protein
VAVVVAPAFGVEGDPQANMPPEMPVAPMARYRMVRFNMSVFLP